MAPSQYVNRIGRLDKCMFCSLERCYRGAAANKNAKQNTRYPWHAVRVKETRASKSLFVTATAWVCTYQPDAVASAKQLDVSITLPIRHRQHHIKLGSFISRRRVCALAGGCFACGSSTTCERFLHFGSRPFAIPPPPLPPWPGGGFSSAAPRAVSALPRTYVCALQIILRVRLMRLGADK